MSVEEGYRRGPDLLVASEKPPRELTEPERAAVDIQRASVRLMHLPVSADAAVMARRARRVVADLLDRLPPEAAP